MKRGIHMKASQQFINTILAEYSVSNAVLCTDSNCDHENCFSKQVSVKNSNGETSHVMRWFKADTTDESKHTPTILALMLSENRKMRKILQFFFWLTIANLIAGVIISIAIFAA